MSSMVYLRVIGLPPEIGVNVVEQSHVITLEQCFSSFPTECRFGVSPIVETPTTPAKHSLTMRACLPIHPRTDSEAAEGGVSRL
jgi:hypothetical protein